MIEFLAERVWDLLANKGMPAPRQVAVAYIGGGASSILTLQHGDTLICDGSDGNLRAGSVSPEAIRTYHAAGALCFSLPGLHAKVMIVGSGDRRHVVVGSANLSTHSRDALGEAAIRTDDPAVVAAAEDAFRLWLQAAEPIDAQWLDHAEAVYRPAGTGPRRSTLPIEAAPMWLIREVPETSEPPGAIALAEAHARRHLAFGLDTVERIRLLPGDESRVRPGDVFMRVAGTANTEPRGNKRLLAWGVVHEVVAPTGRRKAPWAVLLSDSTVTRTPTVSSLRYAVTNAGGHFEWNADEPLSPETAAAVWSLWER